jgi:hypothetical protein
LQSLIVQTDGVGVKVGATGGGRNRRMTMEAIDLSTINYLAVLIAAGAHMAVGLIWFSTRLFGNTWSALTGQSLTPARRWIPAAAVGHLAIAFVLAVLMLWAGVTMALGGLVIALVVWAGFVVTLEIGELVWEKIPVQLFLLRIGNHLVGLSVAGLVLGAWR